MSDILPTKDELADELRRLLRLAYGEIESLRAQLAEARGVLSSIRDEHKALVDTPMKMTFYPPSDQTVDQLVEVQKAIK